MNPDAFLTKKNLTSLLNYVKKLPKFGIIFQDLQDEVFEFLKIVR